MGDEEVQDGSVDVGNAGRESAASREQDVKAGGGDLESEATGAGAEAEATGAAEAKGEKDAEKGQAVEIDARLLHAAERAGLTEDDIASLGEKADVVLGKFADGFDAVSRDFAVLGRQQREQQAPASQQVPATQAKPVMADVMKELAAPLKWAPDEEVMGEEFGKSLQPVVDRINKLQEMLVSGYQSVNELSQWRQEQAAQQLAQNADLFFKGVEDKYGDVLGKGSINDLNPNSPEFKARWAILEDADAIFAGATLQGRKMDFQEAMQRALSLAMAGKQEQLARQEITAKLKKRSKQIIGRPTHRETKPITGPGKDRAKEAFANRLKELGVKMG